MNIIYTAIFYDKNKLVSLFKPVHKNIYAHHSTIEFKPKDTSNLNFGENIETTIIGRLITDKVDCLLVDNPLSKNDFPHITLSTADGIKPFQSNIELKNNQDKIKYYKRKIIVEGVLGYFNGKNIIKENIKPNKPGKLDTRTPKIDKVRSSLYPTNKYVSFYSELSPEEKEEYNKNFYKRFSKFNDNEFYQLDDYLKKVESGEINDKKIKFKYNPKSGRKFKEINESNFKTLIKKIIKEEINKI